MNYSVDVIIPIYKPTKEIFGLIKRLQKQSYPIHKIILMNTEEKYFNQLFYGTGFLEQFKNIEVHHLSVKEFDHGRTRRKAVSYSKSDIFVCMTQDAMPYDEKLIEHLVNGLMQGDRIAAAYAMQLPKENCREIERFTRSFNYPDKSFVKSKEDIPELGIKTFFCSNVCAAYKRDLYEQVGGFVNKTIFNEDMIFAGHSIKQDYQIAYVAEAKVIHSHNYTCMQQFKRNFDLGVSQAQHQEVFGQVSSQSEGKKLVRMTIDHLIATKKFFMIFYLILSSGCKYMGYKLGTHYRSLPMSVIRRCTSNLWYWDN